MIDRHWRWVLLAFGLTLGLLLVGRARAKPFWHDEVFTILASRLSLPALWQASRDGLDLAPPLNTLLTKFAHAVLDVGPVSTRIPPMIGFGTACLLVFDMVRRRSNALVGLAAALVPYFSGAFQYAYEARGYCVAVGLFAIAIFCWSEAASGRHSRRNLGLMAIALASGIWTHYYAVLGFLPIAGGELARQIGRRRFEAAPWVALAGAGVAALPLVPLLIGNTAQAATFWTRLEPTGVASTYDAVLGSLHTARFAFGAGLVGAFALAEFIRRFRGNASSSRRLELHEVVAGLLTLTVPAVATWIGSIAGVFMPRYVLFAVVGFALVVPLAAWRLTPANGVADAILCLAFVLPFVADAGQSLRNRAVDIPNPFDYRPLLAERLATAGPTVLASGLPYLQLWYYTPPDLQQRALYLADPPTELQETGTDTIDRGYLALARWTRIPVLDYHAFVREHRAFDVYACGPDWLSRRLQADGASVQAIRYELGCRLYSVRLPPP